MQHIMKTLLTILTGLIICIGCNKKQTPAKSINEDQEKVNNKQKTSLNIDDIDGSLGNVQYRAFNGVITDTIYLDSLIEMASIHDTIIIDSKVYLSYAVESIGKSSGGKKVSNFEGHFINSSELKESPVPIGKTFKCDKLISYDTALNLGSSCSNASDRIDFERLEIFPDSDSLLLFYLRLPQCSHWTDHTIVKYMNGHFERLFNIESTDYKLDFKIRNDSIVYCHYKQLTEDSSESFDFEFNCKSSYQINTLHNN